MTAYDSAGNESVFSNEISVSPLECTVDANCDDDDACNGVETCSGYSCVAGFAPTCAEPTQCTDFFCDPASGCSQAPRPDGTPCSDGDATTVGDACVGGICRGFVAECTTSSDCDDGGICNGLESRQSFSCVPGIAPICLAPGQCMESFCDAAAGCGVRSSPDGTPCDDGDPATMGDSCSAGVCLGVVPKCTADSECDDGDACNGTEICIGFSCVQGFAPTCTVPTQCMDSFCETQLGCRKVPAPDGTPCDDGDPVTVGDACGGGFCRGAVPECAADADCDDTNFCTADTCGNDLACLYEPLPNGTPCYDFNYDTIGDFCLVGACEATCRAGVDCAPGAERDYVLS